MRTLHYSSTEMYTDSTEHWYAESAVRFNGLIAGYVSAKSADGTSSSSNTLRTRPRER